MKRRGFFERLAALFAAPVVATHLANVEGGYVAELPPVHGIVVGSGAEVGEFKDCYVASSSERKAGDCLRQATRIPPESFADSIERRIRDGEHIESEVFDFMERPIRLSGAGLLRDCWLDFSNAKRSSDDEPWVFLEAGIRWPHNCYFNAPGDERNTMRAWFHGYDVSLGACGDGLAGDQLTFLRSGPPFGGAC